MDHDNPALPRTRVVYLGDLFEAAEGILSVPGLELAGWIYERSDRSASAIRRLCAEFSIPSSVVEAGRDLDQALRKLGPLDLGVIANFGLILSREQLSLPRLGFVNFHFGELPGYPGRNPVEAALRSGERTLGLTLHRVTAEVDAGERIALRRIAASPDRDPSACAERIAKQIPGMMRQYLTRIVTGGS